MTGSLVLDIVIGLVFIYLLYSLLATILQEIVATNLSFRAKVLEVALIRMLSDESQTRSSNFIQSRLHGIWRLFVRGNSKLKEGTITYKFYKNALIKYLAQDQWHSKPSYLSSKNFAKVMIDILRGENPEAGDDFGKKISVNLKNASALNSNQLTTIAEQLDKSIDKLKESDSNTTQKSSAKNIQKIIQEIRTLKAESINPQGETIEFLRSLWADAQGDVEKFRVYLEQWFDDTMDRAVGWYKQYTQVVLFFIGFLIAGCFNVDTLLLVKKLSTNPVLTAQLVEQAGNFTKAHPEFEKEYNELVSKNPNQAEELKKHHDLLFLKSKELLENDIENMNQLLGLGWEKKSQWGCGWLWTGWRPKDSDQWYSTLFGWFITALAISLGAPFWFDLLNKLMKLRGSLASSNKTESKAEGKKIEHEKIIIPKG